MVSCRIHFLKALAGDCFVIEFSNKECIIIDCGFKTTYRDSLKPLLLELNNKGCKVILLLITHTDRDHIEGAIELIKENGNAISPNIIRIDNIWYNGIYNTLRYNPELEYKIGNSTPLQEEKTKRIIAELLSKMPTASCDISASNCIDFEHICLNNGYNLNSCFNKRVVIRDFNTREEKSNSSIQVGACTVNVLSPSEKEIINLSKELNYELLSVLGQNYAVNYDSPFIKLCELILETKCDLASRDEPISATSNDIKSWLGTSKQAEMNGINKASIVVEISYRNTKMLFTGDSESSLWGDLIDDYYDVVKISHHGTTKPNIKMIENTKGNIALISTNGFKNYRHPEKETIARLILSGYRNLYFNYNHPFKNTLIENQNDYNYAVFFEKSTIEV